MNPESPPPAPPGEQQRPSLRSRKGCAVLLVVVFLLVVVTPQLLNNRLWRRGPTLQDKAVMKGLEIAIRGYKTEYLNLPFIGETAPSEDQAYNTSGADGRKLIDILLAHDEKNNPRQIRFWEPPPGKSSGAGYTEKDGLKDIRGKQGYKMILDYNGDGKITNPYAGANDGEPDEISADIIIYSAGANGIFEEGGSKDRKRIDDVKSWQ